MTSSTSKKLFNIKNSNIKETFNTIETSNDEEILLLTERTELDEIFEKLDIPSRRKFIEEETKDYRELNQYKHIFDGLETFKGSHIKTLANKYFLQALMLSQLEGYLPNEAVKFIKEFSIKFENITLLESAFIILAPREYFTEKYRGKECNTYIIFYKPNHNSSSSDNYYINDDTVLIQLYSSGNDFKDNRVYNKYFDKNLYHKDATFSKLGGYIIALLFCIVGTVLLLTDEARWSLLFFISGTLFTIVNSFGFDSNKYWNKKYIKDE